MADGDEWWVVDETLALTLRVSRFYGVAPVRLNSRNGRVAYLSRFHYYIGILVAFILDLLATYKFCFYYQFKNNGTSNITSPFDKRKNIFIINDIAYLIAINIFVLYNFTRMKKILCLVTRVKDIKKTINGEFYQNSKRWQLTCLTLLLIFGPWTPMILNIWLNPKWLKVQILHAMFVDILWLFVVLQFVILARFITATFRDLNERLEDVLLQLNVQHNNTHRTALARKVRYLSRTFVSICKVMLELNSIENINLFFHLCITSFNLGYILNSFLADLAHIDSSEKLYHILGQALFMLYNIIRVLLLVESCQGTREQISRTRLLIGKIMNHVTSRSDQLLEDVETFFKQLLLNDISYAVMRICAIDRHVICVVIGVITTFLSITIN